VVGLTIPIRVIPIVFAVFSIVQGEVKEVPHQSRDIEKTQKLRLLDVNLSISYCPFQGP